MISSTSNPTIKQIRSLRQRKARDESGTCFVEGIRLIGEAAQLGAPIELLIVAPELLSSPFAHAIVADQARAGTPIVEVTRAVFEQISQRDGPQGLGAVVRQHWARLDQIVPGEELCWVALDSVQDPGNLGTILRTADAVGAAGVILLGQSTDPYDPAALRAAMGAIFSQHLVRASFEELLAWKQQHGYRLIGTSDAATVDYLQASYTDRLILLMGSERTGLPTEQQAACDEVVSLPMVGRSDSLNLAVATGVMLYTIFEAQRRRSSHYSSGSR